METTQIFIKTEEKQLKSCSFTGHRELQKDFDIKKLKEVLEDLIKKGVDTFYNGGAIGFDLLCAEAVVSLKKDYPFIKLILCIPCLNQEKYYNEINKNRYIEIFNKADEKIYISNTGYFKGCMQKRDVFLVDKADIIVAFLKKKTGGTAYTVNYAKRKYKEKEILFL